LLSFQSENIHEEHFYPRIPWQSNKHSAEKWRNSMNTKQLTFALFWAIAPFSVLTSAQTSDDSIYLGSVKLTLGEPQQSVISKLSGKYRIDEETSPNWWLVLSCDNQPITGVKVPQPCHGHSIGHVSFKDGRLAAAINDRRLNDEHLSVEFARSLFRAINDLPKRVNQECASTRQEDNQIFERKTITIGCGSRHVRIDITRFVAVGEGINNVDRAETASISEVLEKK
jgi:hypothetical protein